MSRFRGCTLCVLFAFFGVSQSVYADVWLSKQTQLERRAPDGHVVVSVTEAFGRPIGGIDWVDMLAVDQADGSVYTIDGGIPPPDHTPAFGLLRVLKLTKDGAPVFEKVFQYPQGLAVDRGRGGVWVTVSLDDEETARDALLLDAATGEIRARIHGFQSFVGHMAVGSDGALWIEDWGAQDDTWVRLDGTVEELDGYDASAAVGDRHERLTDPSKPAFSPIAVDSSDGRVWVADAVDNADGVREGQLVELSAGGDEMRRMSPGFASIADLALDSRDGSLWAADDRFEGRLVHLSAQGAELARLEQWAGVGRIAQDMTDESLWAVVYPTIDPDTGYASNDVVKIDAGGRVLLTLPDPEDTILYVAPYAAGPATLEMKLDIAPGDGKNLVNARSEHSLVLVALLSDSTFDPLQVDVRSLRFGTAGAVATAHWVRDLNRDGSADLVVLFNVAHAGIKCGDTSAALTGETSNGVAVHGSDAIRTVGCAKPSWHWRHHAIHAERAAWERRRD